MAAWHGERGTVHWPITFASLVVVAAAVGLGLLIVFELFHSVI